jgi:ATP-binding cassette subfamily B (MDR/TAP) protein 1
MYMKVPKGFEAAGDQQEYLLKVKRNLYGARQGPRQWNKFLSEKLESIGFQQSQEDEALFYRRKVLYVLYVDDTILLGPEEGELKAVVEELKEIGLKLTVEGTLEDFLGVKIDRRKGEIEFAQPQIIERILTDLRISGSSVAVKNVPAKVGAPLNKGLEDPEFDQHFDYRSVIGKLNYLEKSTRPDIAFAVHQCARFCSAPKEKHGKVVKWIGRYLAGNREQGIIMKPTAERSIDCYVDADFAGNWEPSEALEDPATSKSRTGFLVMYAGCPIVWASRMQQEMTLSTT